MSNYARKWSQAHMAFAYRLRQKGLTLRQIMEELNSHFLTDYSLVAVQTKLNRLSPKMFEEPQKAPDPPYPPEALPPAYRTLLLRVESFHNRPSI
jgi:hypothetical protein